MENLNANGDSKGEKKNKLETKNILLKILEEGRSGTFHKIKFDLSRR